jgi:magnesium chelatase subunit D
VHRIAAHFAAAGIASIVVDCEAGPIRLGLAADLAVALDGQHVPMTDLAATVRETLDPARQAGHPRSSSHNFLRKAA